MPVTLGWEQTEVAVDEDDGSVTLRALAITTTDKRPEDSFTFDAIVTTVDGSATQPVEIRPWLLHRADKRG